MNDQNSRISKTNLTKLIICLMVCISLVGQSGFTMPFLFLSPFFDCKDGNSCSQELACSQRNQISQKLSVHMLFNTTTIVSQYSLFCEQKVNIPLLQTFKMFGHATGSTLTIFFISKIKMNNILSTLSIACLFIFIFSLMLAFGNWNYVLLGYFGWSALNQVLNNLAPICVPYFYQSDKVQKKLVLINGSFAIYSLLNPLIFYLVSSWRSFIFIIIGLPSIILCFTFFKINNKLFQTKQQQNQILVIFNKDEQISTNQLSLVDIFKSQYGVPFACAVIISLYPFLSFFCILLSINNLAGNFILNYQLFLIFQAIGGISGFLILHWYRPNFLIKLFFLTIGFLLIIKSFFPSFVQNLILVLCQSISQIMFGVCVAYGSMILPGKYLGSLYSVKYFLMFLIGTLLPSIVFYASKFEINYFLIVGMIEISGLYFINLGQRHKSKLNEGQQKK